MDTPRCRNKDCSRKPNMVLGRETETEWVFCCADCNGLHIITKPEGRKKAAMEMEFQRSGSIPEWAKRRVYFGLGSRRM